MQDAKEEKRASVSNHIIAQLHASFQIVDSPLQPIAFWCFVAVLLTEFGHPLLRVVPLLVDILFVDVQPLGIRAAQ